MGPRGKQAAAQFCINESEKIGGGFNPSLKDLPVSPDCRVVRKP